MVKNTSKKETGKLFEEKRKMKQMMDFAVKQESNPNRVDVNRADTRGMTPLHAAGIRSGKEIIDILCRVNGIDLNPKDCYGRTPLMIACMTNNEEAVRTLLAQPTIDLYTKDDQGRSLEYYAQRNNTIHTMLINTRMNPTEIQELARVKNILNNHIVERENREEEEEEKIKTILDDHAAEEHANYIHKFDLDEYELRFRRKEKMKKKRNCEDIYSAENVENYQGHLDLDTILSNIENKPPKSKSVSKGAVGAMVREPGQCANTRCNKRSQHRCSRCLAVSFCSTECSIQFWPQHRRFCQPVRTRENSLSEVD